MLRRAAVVAVATARASGKAIRYIIAAVIEKHFHRVERGLRIFDNFRISRAGYPQFIFLGGEPFNNVLLIKCETEFLRKLAASRQTETICGDGARPFLPVFVPELAEID